MLAIRSSRSVGTALAALLAVSVVHANDEFQTTVLKLFPQADANGDGVLSDAEETALSQRVLNRYPKADQNGDGVLSDDEKKRMLRMAANRAKSHMPKNAMKPNAAKPNAAKPNAAKPGTAKSTQNLSKTGMSPTFANIEYGDHERQVLDLWLADTSEPAPLAIYIHGGGFRSGSKEKLNPKDLARLLESGISVAAINYRYATIAPLPAAHQDAKRALQFIRSKSEAWNIDKDRVAAFGGSAGAQICMWLAFTDEMANPESTDPIERESTRLSCVATAGGQTSNGAEFWKKMIGPLLGDNQPVESLARPLNGEQDPEKARIAMWGAKTLEEANSVAAQHSALNIVSSDDPPIFMSYGMSPTDPLPTDPKRIRGWLIHHVNLGLALKEKTDEIELEAHLKYPGSESKYVSLVDFFQSKLLNE